MPSSRSNATDPMRAIEETYTLQATLVDDLYAVTQNLILRTKVAMEYAGREQVGVLADLLGQHERLSQALEEFASHRES